ncbi:MAG: D-2-hydroxyacid dehydrogenase [Cyanobacteria bacterium]|nr:D-2-hydroxyacid dehydrogenase [Cyanobacteriota bacterium]
MSVFTSPSPRPRLVLLDGYTSNPGDLDWEPLERLGDLTVYERTAADQVLERIAAADVVLTNKTRLDAASLASASGLRGVVVLATGFDVVDAAAARRLGLPVCNVPEYGTQSVAQAVFALVLELTNHTGSLASSVRQGRWSAGPDFCYWDQPLIELAGLTFGIVGMGRIGAAVARIAEAFGMRVLSLRRSPDPTSVPLDQLLRQSDVVSLHCPLRPETQGLIDAAHLGRMKPGALLINTGRGALINEVDLAAALASGHLGGAGLDVLSLEPPRADHPLLSAPNCLITPHVAWATQAARRRLIAVSAGNVAALLAGRPLHVVNAG